jgi:hypothetical protein
MSATTTTQFLFTAAAAAYGSLKRGKGQRPQAVKAFLDATTNDQRDEAIEAWGAGFVRRGLHEASVMFTRKGDLETANVFESLRDSVSDDGFLDFDTEVEDEAVAV